MIPGGRLGGQEEVYRSVFPAKSSCSRQRRGQAAPEQASKQELWAEFRFFWSRFQLDFTSQWSDWGFSTLPQRLLVSGLFWCTAANIGSMGIAKSGGEMSQGWPTKHRPLCSQTQLSMPHNPDITEAVFPPAELIKSFEVRSKKVLTIICTTVDTDAEFYHARAWLTWFRLLLGLFCPLAAATGTTGWCDIN